MVAQVGARFLELSRTTLKYDFISNASPIKVALGEWDVEYTAPGCEVLARTTGQL